MLAIVADFETDLIPMRTREGMKVAKANGQLRGKQAKLKPNHVKHLLELHDLGTYTQAEQRSDGLRGAISPVKGLPSEVERR